MLAPERWPSGLLSFYGWKRSLVSPSVAAVPALFKNVVHSNLPPSREFGPPFSPVIVAVLPSQKDLCRSSGVGGRRLWLLGWRIRHAQAGDWVLRGDTPAAV